VIDEELCLLSQRVGDVLQQTGLTLATAESSTGGWLAKAVTDTAGSSAWFVCGVVADSEKVKSKLLSVSDVTLARHGNVSEDTAFEMAEGALYRTDADVSVALTGISEANSGPDKTPVGTVCFAWYRRDEKVKITKHHFEGDRNLIRRQAVVFALEGLLNYLASLSEAHEPSLPQSGSNMESKPAAAPIAKSASPFHILNEGKTLLTELFAGLRIDQTVFGADSIDGHLLANNYRAAIAALASAQRKYFFRRVNIVSGLIQEACEKDADAMIGSAHLDGDGLYTVLHPLHQGVFVELIGKCLGMPPLDRLSVISGALTANIAMLNLQEILQRQAEQLSPSQQQLLKLHPVLAEAMLTELDVDDALWLQSIRSHHERVDGQGYPHGTSAEQIPLGSRLISLADIYDAMIKPRAHREPNQRAALKELFLRRGQAIDENLAPIAVKEIGIYPPGAFVKLRNGEIAVVIKRTANSLHPIVRSLFGPRGAPLERPYRRNTEESMFAIQDVVPRDRSIVLNLGRIWDYE
jgi:PncC family amidohydrolase